VHVHGIVGNMKSEIVGRSVRMTGLDASPGQPHREGGAVMVAARIIDAALGDWRPSELAPPDYERVCVEAHRTAQDSRPGKMQLASARGGTLPRNPEIDSFVGSAYHPSELSQAGTSRGDVLSCPCFTNS
jgi:hypothetical protein